MIEINLPFPPTVNSYYSHTRNGVFISSKGKKFRGAAAAEFFNQTGGSFAPLDVPICVEILLCPPDKRKRDLDNYMKALLDALTHCGLWTDDSLIDQLFIYRGPATSGGLVTVQVNLAGPIIERIPD